MCTDTEELRPIYSHTSAGPASEPLLGLMGLSKIFDGEKKEPQDQRRNILILERWGQLVLGHKQCPTVGYLDPWDSGSATLGGVPRQA